MTIPELDRTGRACSGGRDRDRRRDLPERTAGHLPDHEGRGDWHRHPGPAGPADRLVSCAIRGNATVRSRAEADGHVRVLAGMPYYFCCADCAALFDADPLAYAASA